MYEYIKTFRTRTIGIWGFGITGKAAAKFFTKHGIAVRVYDQRELTAHEREFLRVLQIPYDPTISLEQFLIAHDYIIPSHGIDLRPWQAYKHKFLYELDIFMRCNTIPCIGITGSIGKTSLTTLLKELLGTYYQRVEMGGNIGISLFDLLEKHADYYVIELSSFQLEHSTACAPELAIVSNIYPNHLDRHASLQAYIQAKCQIMCQQKDSQRALLPLSCKKYIDAFFPERLSRCSFFSLTTPEESTADQPCYWMQDGSIIKKELQGHREVFSLDKISLRTYPENLLILGAALDMLQLPGVTLHIEAAPILEHRCEFIGNFKGIDFYNDSKATVMESVLAAVQLLSKKPILLLMGGLSKGVDRTRYMEFLRKLKGVLFFGAEANTLYAAAQQAGVTAYPCSTLEHAFFQALQVAKSGDQILLSPGGSSYDLFAHYQERGNCFKRLFSQIDKNSI